MQLWDGDMEAEDKHLPTLEPAFRWHLEGDGKKPESTRHSYVSGLVL